MGGTMTYDSMEGFGVFEIISHTKRDRLLLYGHKRKQ